MASFRTRVCCYAWPAIAAPRPGNLWPPPPPPPLRQPPTRKTRLASILVECGSLPPLWSRRACGPARRRQGPRRLAAFHQNQGPRPGRSVCER